MSLLDDMDLPDTPVSSPGRIRSWRASDPFGFLGEGLDSVVRALDIGAEALHGTGLRRISQDEDIRETAVPGKSGFDNKGLLAMMKTPGTSRLFLKKGDSRPCRIMDKWF